MDLRRRSHAVILLVTLAAIAACGGGDSGGTGPVVVTPNNTPSTIQAVSATAQSGTAGLAVTEAPSVKVLNSAGQPVSGVVVTFAVSSGGGSVSGGSAATSSAGIATAGQWTLGGTTGANTVTASAASLAPVSFQATGAAGAAARLVLATAPSSSVVSRATFATQPVVQVQDANGNLVLSSSIAVSAAVTGTNVLAGTTTINASAGIASFTNLSLSGLAGAQTITFTAPALTSATANMTLVGGAASRAVISAGNNQTVGGGLAVTVAPSVLVTDQDANPVAGTPVTFAIVAGGGALAGAAQVTNSSGIATAGTWTLGAVPGANSLTASVNGVPGATVTFNATATILPATSLVVNAGGSQAGVAGAAVTAKPSLIARNVLGNPVAGVVVTFAATSGGGVVTGATQTTDAAGIATVGGWTLGTVAGSNALAATAAGVAGSAAFTASASPDVPARLAVDRQPLGGTSGLALTQQPIISVQDQYGNIITTDAGRTISAAISAGGDGALTGTVTASTAAGKATFSNLVITGLAAGTRTLTFSSAGLTAIASQSVSLGAAPLIGISMITPAVLAPGATATITGIGFAVVGSTVTVDGIATPVTAATTTQLTVTLPADLFGCGPQRTVNVVVNANTLTATSTAPIATATSRPLAVGESVILSNQSDLGCNQLTAGGTYAVTVFNTSTAGSGTTSFQLRGGPTGALPGLVATQALRAAQRLPEDLPEGRFFEPSRNELVRRSAHLAHLEHERELFAQSAALERTVSSAKSGLFASSAVTPVPITIGATSTMRFNFINENATMTVRTVFVAPHVVVVEDIANSRNHEFDAYYATLANEFETTMYPLLVANFGDPLAKDALMNRTGRVTMVFTDRVTNITSGVAGFVTSCDVRLQTSCASSNEAPTAYLSVPLATWSGTGAQDPAWWQRYMHFVLMHEMKHVVSNAEKAARNALVLEESWLEEGSAEIAGEIYTRAGCGFGARVKTTYASLKSCETANIATWSPTMTSAIGYDWYQFYAGIETLSPIVGNVIVNGQLQFFNYESAWSLLRWAADSYGANDASFFKALNVETSMTGVSNLLARTPGQTLTSMLGEWSLMVATDDRPGFTATNPRLSLANWKSRDFMAGTRTAYNLSTAPFPLPVHTLGTTAFAQNVSAVAAGASSIFEVGALNGPAQFFSLRNSSGTTLPANSTLRIGVVRVQ